MILYNKNLPLFSIHIPKCGGTSFIKVLNIWFNGNFYPHYYNEKRNQMPTQYNLKPGMCMHGHFNNNRGTGVFDYYPNATQFITFLRDPLEIAISNYFYVKNNENSHFRNGKPFKINEQYKNIEHFLISSKSYLLGFFPHAITMANYKNIIESFFIHIGIIEDFQASINVLADKLAMPPIHINHLNISKRDGKIPNHIKDVFIKNNPLEFAIYNYVLGKHRNLQ